MQKIREEAMLCGVCAGMAKYFNVSVVLVRLAFTILTIMGVGCPILIYILLAILMPKAESEE